MTSVPIDVFGECPTFSPCSAAAATDACAALIEVQNTMLFDGVGQEAG